MSVQRRTNHWAIDRTRTLAKRGKTSQQIADETGIPLINVMAYTHGIKPHADQANQKRETHDRQIRQDDNQADSAEGPVSQPEDRNAQID